MKLHRTVEHVCCEAVRAALELDAGENAI